MKKQAIFSKVKGIFAKTREWIIKHKGISSFLLGLVVGLWFIPWVITMASTGTPKSLIELVRNTSYGDSTLIQQKKVPYTLTATFAKAVLIVVQFSRQKSEDFLVSPKREAEWTGGSPVDGYAA